MPAGQGTAWGRCTGGQRGQRPWGLRTPWLYGQGHSAHVPCGHNLHYLQHGWRHFSTWPGVGSGCPAGVGSLPPSALAPRSCASPGSGSGPEQTGEICKQALTGPRCLPSPGPSRDGDAPAVGWGCSEWSPAGHREVAVLPTRPGDGCPWVGTDPVPAPSQLGRKRAEPGQRLAWVIRLCAGRPGRMGLCHAELTGPPPCHAGCSSATRGTDGVPSLQTPLLSAWQTGVHRTG